MNEEIDQIITVNGLFQGPTLIVKSHATVVVDLVNNMKEETSIHWHGMHQYNVPGWMVLGISHNGASSRVVNSGRFVFYKF